MIAEGRRGQHCGGSREMVGASRDRGLSGAAPAGADPGTASTGHLGGGEGAELAAGLGMEANAARRGAAERGRAAQSARRGHMGRTMGMAGWTGEGHDAGPSGGEMALLRSTAAMRNSPITRSISRREAQWPGGPYFSHLWTVAWSTPKRVAKASWLSPRRRRTVFMLLPVTMICDRCTSHALRQCPAHGFLIVHRSDDFPYASH